MAEVKRTSYFQRAYGLAKRGIVALGQSNASNNLKELMDATQKLSALQQSIESMERKLAIRPFSSVVARSTRDIFDLAIADNPERKDFLETWWQEMVQLVKEQIKPKTSAITDIDDTSRFKDLLGKVEPWLGVFVLNPNDTDAASELSRLLINSIHEMELFINRRIVDHSASSTRANMVQNSTSDVSFHDEDILHFQIQEEQNILQDLIHLKSALDICAKFEENTYGPSMAKVGKLEANLIFHIEKLSVFQKNIFAIKFTAVEKGLKNGNWESIDSDMAVGGSTENANHKKFIEIPVEFAVHPTFLWLKDDYVESLKHRRKEEERRAAFFSWCAEMQNVIDEDDLLNVLSEWVSVKKNRSLSELMENIASGDGVRDSKDIFLQLYPEYCSKEFYKDFKTEFLRELKLCMVSGVPLELAFKILKEMQETEKNDETRLQGKLRFEDWYTRRKNSGLREIVPMLQPIVEQINYCRNSLTSFRVIPSSSRGHFGVVSWAEECKKVVELLRSDNIPDAQKRVQIVIGTDDYNENNDQSNYLSLKSAINQLEKLAGSFKKPLSNVANKFEDDRRTLVQEFNMQLEQCKVAEERIREINKKVKTAWDEVQDALDATEKAKFWQRTERIGYLKVTIENYLKLCPKSQKILHLGQNHPVVASFKDSVVESSSYLYEDLCSLQ